MNKYKLHYNNIYFCGECYFSYALKEFLQKNTSANIQNLSIGSGSTETFLTILKYKKCFDPGIFLLGGSIHDKWGWNNGETLNDILSWFNTSLYDSSLVLCLTGPYEKTTDSIYDHRLINEYKQKFAEQHNIPYLDLRINKEHIFDNIHFNTEGKEIFNNKILEFLINQKPKLINPKIEKIERTTDRLEINNCKRFTIIHEHNNALLDIFNNEKLVKQLTPYRLLSSNPTRIPYIDRTLYNNFIKPHHGFIRFSEPVFIHATITYF
jgi:hypothetical protein